MLALYGQHALPATCPFRFPPFWPFTATVDDRRLKRAVMGWSSISVSVVVGRSNKDSNVSLLGTDRLLASIDPKTVRISVQAS